MSERKTKPLLRYPIDGTVWVTVYADGDAGVPWDTRREAIVWTSAEAIPLYRIKITPKTKGAT